MATFIPGNGKVTLNGTTEVNLVTAPASGVVRIVRGVSIFNADSVSHDITLRVDDGTDYDLTTLTIAAGATGRFDVPINLTSADVLKLVSDATATTTEPVAFASYAEVS